MNRKMLLAAAALLAGVAGSANAQTFITTPGSAASFAPTPGDVNTFDTSSPLAPGFTLTGSGFSLVTGDTATSAEPAFSDGSQYLSVAAGGTATLANLAMGYQSVSIFLGSIDSYNSVDLLDSLGNVIGSFAGFQFTAPDPADGNQVIPSANRRVTFYRSDSNPLIYGVRFNSQFNSLETDNVVFAVPEASTWAMMLSGFALIGLAIRSRRRRSTKVVYA